MSLAVQSLFAGIDVDTLAAIESALEWFSLPAGSTLFREGESFNGKHGVELFNREAFYALAERTVLIEAWRLHHNTKHLRTARHVGPLASETIAMPSCRLVPLGSASTPAWHHELP